jgi:hypothetical protein
MERLNTSINENRFIPVESKEVKFADQPELKPVEVIRANPVIQPEPIVNRIIPQVVIESELSQFDRKDMMKEVNDIISELQGILKPKMFKIETEEKQERLRKAQTSNLRE